MKEGIGFQRRNSEIHIGRQIFGENLPLRTKKLKCKYNFISVYYSNLLFQPDIFCIFPKFPSL